MADKTSYTQCLTHMIKGNLGAGILAMPATFKHLGLIGSVLGLPFLCIVSAYCVHLLVGSSRKLETKSKDPRFSQENVNYSSLARGVFELGPERTRRMASFVSGLVDTCLLATQIGVCCVYVIFVVDNITSILASYHIIVRKTLVFLAIFPVTLMLSFIRTLARLTVASLLANLLQTIGLALIVEYLLRDMDKLDLRERDNTRPISEMALGFGSAMFAFEGISVVLPLYSRMRQPRLMSTWCGVINVSFFVILILYFLMGLLGYLKFGHAARDSITLNLPATPLYDAVRAMFTASILLSYPLQFYVPNEIIWNWARKNLLKPIRRQNKIAINDSKHRQQQQQQQQETHAKFVLKEATKANGTMCLVAAANSELVNSNGSGNIATKELPTIDEQQVVASVPVKSDSSFTNAAIGETKTATATDDEQNFKDNKLVAKNLIAKFDNENHRHHHHHHFMNGNTTTTKSTIMEVPTTTTTTRTTTTTQQDINDGISDDDLGAELIPERFEYYCRLTLVLLTFALAMTVPKLNLLMDLIGSFSGAFLCLTVPTMIHLAAFWQDTNGFTKVVMILFDGAIIIGSISAGLGGSLSSLVAIVKTFHP